MKKEQIPISSVSAGAVAARSLSLLQLGTALGCEITDVVERMHGTIARRPLPFGTLETDGTWGITRVVYATVRGCLTAATSALGAAARLADGLSESESGAAWSRIRAAVNGVTGDSLERLGNPLAYDLELVARSGSGPTLLLFAHGLCMNELAWQRGAFPEFASWCTDTLGAQIAHVRYNSGRHVSTNGRTLAGLLEHFIQPERIERLVLIGHSMGGLLSRSAFHYGERAGHAWPRLVTHVATLGTPHHGAPAERIGSFSNRLLSYSPYSRPLAWLGGLRSEGIRDLRYGNLVDEDWVEADPEHADDRRTAVPLAPGVRYLFVAATRSTEMADTVWTPELPEPVWKGQHDLLVTVPSALGLSRDESRRLEHPGLERHVVAGLDHMALMGDARVFDRLRAWLAE